MHIRAMALVVSVALAGLAPAAGADADANAKKTKDLVHKLLGMEAPTPDWREAVEVLPRGQVPPDDAPIEVLLAFWSYEAQGPWSTTRPPGPTAKVQSRLLAAVIRKPRRFPSYEWLLPESPEAVAKIKAVYDKLGGTKNPATSPAPESSPAPVDPVQELRRQIHDWLLTRSLYFRDELIRNATNARFDEYVIGQDAMAALARLDWQAAEPILKKHAADSGQNVATAALALAYEHADKTGDQDGADKLRRRLRAIAQDRKAHKYARECAFRAVMDSGWAGREDWFVSLFPDPTWAYGWPLRAHVDRDPNHWIPTLTKMVASKDRPTRDNAVSCLIARQPFVWPPRKDTLIPLLPWLSDPNWSSAPYRGGLISALSYVYIPESVPGLLRILRNETGEAQHRAAGALGRYRVKEAGPDLRKMYERDKNREDGFLHIEALSVAALLACGAITDEQVANLAEAHARQVMADPNMGPFVERGIFEEGRPRLPRREGPGWSALPDDDSRRDKELKLPASGATADRPAQILLARGRKIGDKEPKLAESIVAVLLDSPAPAVDRELIRLLGRTRSVNTVLSALHRSEDMRKNVPRELAEMARAGGAAAGVAAAVLAEPEACRKLLRGKDKPAQVMLLACARLIRTALPVEDVAALWKPADELLAMAAERYLESEDSPAARKIVWAHHPGEVLILGGPDSFDPWSRRPDFPGDIREPEYEKRLRKEMQDHNRPDAIIAMITGNAGGGRGNWIIRRKGSQCRVTFEPPPNWHLPNEQKREGSWSRELTSDESRRLMDMIVKGRFDDLPALYYVGSGQTNYEYLHLTSEGGRRVFMMDPTFDDSATTPYGLMVRFFGDLEP